MKLTLSYTLDRGGDVTPATTEYMLKILGVFFRKLPKEWHGAVKFKCTFDSRAACHALYLRCDILGDRSASIGIVRPPRESEIEALADELYAGFAELVEAHHSLQTETWPRLT